MVDYFPISNTHKLPEPDLGLEEEQGAPEPVIAEAVYNYHEDAKSKTIAIKLTLQLPRQ
jgi:hypothetical protein